MQIPTKRYRLVLIEWLSIQKVSVISVLSIEESHIYCDL